MPPAARFLLVFLFFASIVHGLDNDASYVNSITKPDLDATEQTRSPPTDGAVVLTPNKMGNPGLSIPKLLSSLLSLQPPVTTTVTSVPTSNPAIPATPIGGPGPLSPLLAGLDSILSPLLNLPGLVPSTLASTGSLPTSQAERVGSSGDTGGLGGLFSGAAADPLNILPTALVPLEPIVSVLSSLLSRIDTPGPQDILLPLVPIPTSLPSVPAALSTLPVSGIPDIVPALTALPPVDIAPFALLPSLVSAIEPLLPQLITELPADITLLAGLESVLNADLEAIVPSQLHALTSAIAEEINVLSGHTFSAGSLTITDASVVTVDLPFITLTVPVSSVLTDDCCSVLSMVSGTMVMVSVSCGSTASTTPAVTTVTIPTSPSSVPASTTPAVPPTITVPFGEPATSSPQSLSTATTATAAPQRTLSTIAPGPQASLPLPATVTITVVEISTVTTCSPTSLQSSTCPSVVRCPECPPVIPCPASNTAKNNPNTASTPSNGAQGPCPGQGYTCNDCPDGWFCPPIQTPAGAAPCGYGWPCYHCEGGWFCAPAPTLVPTTVTVCTEPAASTGAAVPGLGSVAGSGAGSGAGSETGPEGNSETPVTVTATAFVTVSDPALPDSTPHAPVAGCKYIGCYKDDTSRALKNASITTTIPGGMTNEICIKYCRAGGFNLAATEYGFECYCGNVLVNSYLKGEADCNKPCPGAPGSMCGGDWAMSLWSDNGEVPMDFGPEEHFIEPSLAAGQTAVSVYYGGLRQTVVLVTTPVYEWPAEEPTKIAMAVASQPYAATTSIDVEGLASSAHAIVSAAIHEAHAIAASEAARAQSMIVGTKVNSGNPIGNVANKLDSAVVGGFPERVAWTTYSTTVTASSTTTTLFTKTTCTENSVFPPFVSLNISRLETVCDTSSTISGILPTVTDDQPQGRITTVIVNSEPPVVPEPESLTLPTPDAGSNSVALLSSCISVQPRSSSPQASAPITGPVSPSKVTSSNAQPASSEVTNPIIFITVTTTVPSAATNIAPRQQSSVFSSRSSVTLSTTGIPSLTSAQSSGSTTTQVVPMIGTSSATSTGPQAPTPTTSLNGVAVQPSLSISLPLTETYVEFHASKSRGSSSREARSFVA
ncbi:hypothetical protein QBC35DRAFT_232960 [Podospora australis]|uniref:WSC domain-containing protein n=1 Tax=Podospora australis TaxID=1536484 RepID=A0AAN6WSV1_9PEZI|nr:hypothetical protein QBC35DRAFT_232960 [Podospora australis]